jgi:DNA polymerase-3 subunit gamma/tau
MLLANKYRPSGFGEIVGQRSVSLILRQMAIKESIPAAMVFEGAAGLGKTSSARILGAALNCDMTPGPCGSCVSCVAVLQGKSLDVLEIDGASNGLVDDIRALRETVRYTINGRKRVVILDECQSLRRDAFNVLLNMLEEPAPDNVFVLLTTELRRIPDTVLSRCMTFNFRRLTVHDMTDRLAHICTQENLDAEKPLLRLIAERADGGMRDAVMLLDQVTRVGIRTVEQFLEVLGEDDFAPGLIAAMYDADVVSALRAVDEQLYRTGDPQTITTALVRCLRDLMVLKGGSRLTCQASALAARERLAVQIGADRILAALTVLWQVQTTARLGDDGRCTLELAIVVMSEQLSKGRPSAQPAPLPIPTPIPVRRLSLDEMQAM